MNAEGIRKSFQEFLKTYNEEKHRAIWIEYEKTFRVFWQSRVLAFSSQPLPEGDYDPIIRIIDTKARGFNQETDEAVARVNLTMGMWYRIFNALKEKKDIQITMDKIFKSDEERVLVAMVDRLEKENASNRNGLTGEKAVALNALLYINNPFKFVSVVSLAHRFQIQQAFGFANPEGYRSYGEKVIHSNRDIIIGFREKFGINVWPRTLTRFLYGVPEIKNFWFGESATEEIATPEEPTISASEAEFALEEQLEDFLVANWETTELGKKYDLLEGEPPSQQYPADKWEIDLLVRDKSDGSYVVIELKKGQTNDATVGQLTRYIGWVQKHLANGKLVKGIIIAHSDDKGLRYAVQAVPNTEFLVYHMSFHLEKLQ